MLSGLYLIGSYAGDEEARIPLSVKIACAFQLNCMLTTLILQISILLQSDSSLTTHLELAAVRRLSSVARISQVGLVQAFLSAAWFATATLQNGSEGADISC